MSSSRVKGSIYNRELFEKIKYQHFLLQLYFKNIAIERRSFRLGSQRLTCAVHPKAFLFLALKEFLVLELAKKKKKKWKRFARKSQHRDVFRNVHRGPLSHSHTISSTGTTLCVTFQNCAHVT